MKKRFTTILSIVLIMASKSTFGQWSPANAQGNMSNINTGSVIFNGTVDQRNLNPNGGPLDPNGGTFAQVNANFGGLVFHSTGFAPASMNSFWGQNFDYHNNNDIRYRINQSAAMMQFANGNMYFYTAPSGSAGAQINAFKFLPKISLANNGGFAIGSTFAIGNTGAPGTLLVENNIGLGIQTPTAQLHTTGTVRLQGLTTGGVPNNIVSIDANGQLWRSPLNTGVQNLCATSNFVPKSITGGALDCSQIFDDGVSVGLGQSSNFAYTGLSVVGSVIPPATGTAKLAVNGVIMSLAYFATSDENMKKNIRNIPDALGTINKLQGKLYEWKSDAYPGKGMDKNTQIGFLAQDLAKVIPASVVRKEDGTYAVNYNSLIPVLAEGIKEQGAVIEQLKNEILELKKDIAGLINKEVPGKSQAKYFTISPNPFTQETKLQYNLGNTKAKAVCLVYNLQGKIVKQISLNGSTGVYLLTKNNLSAGVYFVSLTLNNSEIQTEKVIITE